jgi:hypothetical protein
MTVTNLLQFLSALLLSFTLMAQNARGGPEIRPSPRVNAADDITTEVKNKLDREFKNKKFDAGSDPKQTIRTSLSFSVPEEIRTKVITTVGQEFKKLDDVYVGFGDVDYEVSIVVSVVSGKSNEPLYIISLVVTKSPAAVKANPKQFSALMGHTVETGVQLQDLCKRVATETNAHAFEEERKARKMSREMSPTPSPSR